MGPFEFILLCVHWATWIFIFTSFIKFGKILAIVSSNNLSALFSFSCPCGSPTIHMLVWLMVLHRCLRFYSLSFSHFSFCFSEDNFSFALLNLLILSSVCSKLPLNPYSVFFISVIVLFQPYNSFCLFFSFRFSVSLLIFPFCSYIIFMTFPLLP